MAYTVGRVAKITGLSVRALHHYDEIGLVRPSHRTRAGYRQYTEDDLDRLQQVLLQRELGLSLDEIARVLDDPRFDRRAALIAHRAALVKRLEETRALVALVDRTLHAMDTGEVMKSEEKFEAFDPAKFEAEAEARWGHTESFAESRRRTARYGEADWARMRAELDAITKGFADALGAGRAPSDPEVQALVERHRDHIDRWFYPCSHAHHAKLAVMYVDDPRFAANFDRHREGLAVFVRDAILAVADEARS